jgi:hypothetical protein
MQDNGMATIANDRKHKFLSVKNKKIKETKTPIDHFEGIKAPNLELFS